MDDCGTVWIKKEATDEVPDEPTSMVQFHPSGVDVKEELEEGENEEFVADTLRISCSTDYISEEPEVILEVNETETIMLTSPRYESDCTRFTKNSSERCGISFEELVKQEVIHDQLEKSTHATLCSAHIQGLTLEEDTVLATRLKCTLREKKFQKFCCSFCLQSFPSKYELIMHVFMHIDGVQPPRYVCKSCGEVFRSNVSLSKHSTMCEDDEALSLSSTETFHSSSDCRKNSLEGDQELSFMEATEKPSSSKETWIFSNKCFNGTNNTHTIAQNAEKLDKHDNYETLSKSGDVNDQAFQLTAERPHKCDVCGKSFTRLNHLRNHSLLHVGMKPHKCDICGQSFTASSNLKSHELTHTGKRPHKCTICGKSFTQTSTLKRHVFTHSGQKPYKCNVCGKNFTRSSHLQAHSLIHTGKRPHKCNVCGKSFTDSGTLRKHALRHTGMRPHKCDICGKCFTLLGELNRHALSHIGKSPNTCDVCGESFTQLDDLKRHALIHIESRPHICHICGKCFTYAGSLKRHTLRHTGLKSHKCDICGRSFTEFDTLKRHSLIHSGEKPHQCDICGQSFIQFGNFKRHSLTHSGIRPYKCDICDKSFIDSSTFKRHSLIHSRMTPHM